MVPSKSQCDRERLRELLDDRLSPKDQDELSKHLESCVNCRQELESMAADPKWWNDAQHLLSTVVNLDNTTSTNDAAKSGIIKIGKKNPESRLGFLSPSDDPTKLGRLGSYEIVKVIGRGGMGIVLKSFDASLNRYVAIKVLAPQWTHSTAARRRFAREAQAAAAVVHEHVIAIHAVDSANDTPYLVMPFINGRSLQERIDQTGPLELKEILRIGLQISAGLAAAHAQGLVHRDIKPANILLENGVERVLITDFGLARAVDDASFTRSCFIAGTPEYMAPEQANGENVDQRVDLFSLGSVIYAMCTGNSPFHRETTMGVLRQICEGSPRPIREINKKIPKWLEQIVARLHAKNPAERFQSADEVAKLLRNWLAHIEQPSVNQRPRDASKPWLRLTRFSKSNPRVRWFASVAILLIIAGVAVTEMTGGPRMFSSYFGDQKARPQKKAIDSLAADEDLLEQRIADLEQQIAELKASLSTTAATITTTKETATASQSQTVATQPQPVDSDQDQQIDQPQTGPQDSQQDDQTTEIQQTESESDSAINNMIEYIEQLKEDLYRDFP